MLTDRNRTSHMYDETSIRAIEGTIAETYQDALTSLKTALVTRAEQIEQTEQHE